MAATDTRNLAVFCDFENVALGAEDAKFERFDIRLVLENGLRLNLTKVFQAAHAQYRVGGFASADAVAGDLMAFFADIGQDPELAVRMGGQILAEAQIFLGAHLEHALGAKLAIPPGIGGQALGVEVEEAAGNHVLILLMTS